MVDCKKRPSRNSGSGNSSSARQSTKSLTFLWGATGEQEWTPALTTGKFIVLYYCLPGVFYHALFLVVCIVLVILNVLSLSTFPALVHLNLVFA